MGIIGSRFIGTPTVNQFLFHHFLTSSITHSSTLSPTSLSKLFTLLPNNSAIFPSSPTLPYSSIYSCVPSICLLFSNKSCLSHLNSSHLTRKSFMRVWLARLCSSNNGYYNCEWFKLNSNLISFESSSIKTEIYSDGNTGY